MIILYHYKDNFASGKVRMFYFEAKERRAYVVCGNNPLLRNNRNKTSQLTK